MIPNILQTRRSSTGRASGPFDTHFTVSSIASNNPHDPLRSAAAISSRYKNASVSPTSPSPPLPGQALMKTSRSISRCWLDGFGKVCYILPIMAEITILPCRRRLSARRFGHCHICSKGHKVYLVPYWPFRDWSFASFTKLKCNLKNASA